MRLPIRKENAMKTHQFPHFHTKQTELNGNIQAALNPMPFGSSPIMNADEWHEAETLQEMQMVIALADLLKTLEKSS
ncbi:hypothetical protein HBA47_08485 [Kingella kingae]|nr:hypothetical protein HBA47_08485 [Kingella kingae]